MSGKIGGALAALMLTMALARPALAEGPPEAPYAPDEHTLFLHHFDGNLEADFAKGAAAPVNDPGQRHFIEGVLGQALVFNRSQRELQFATEGNYDPAAGTIEFFVRLPDIGPAGFTGSRGFWQTRGGQSYGGGDRALARGGQGYGGADRALARGGQPLEKMRFVIGRGDFNRARTNTRPEDLFADLLDGQLGLKTSIADWKADEWHHVAVLWDERSARLLLDGACVARGEFPGLSAGVPVFDVGTNAFVVMDELRISDVLREELQVADKVEKPTEFKPITAADQKKPELPELPRPPQRHNVITLRSGAANLFVDDYLIESQSKLIRRLGQVRKHEGNPVINPEGLWEQTAAFPFSGGAYRLEPDQWLLWYQTYIRWLRGSDRTSMCLAQSQDGVHWTKPELELFEVRGVKPNNVVLARALDNATVIHDPSDPDPSQRFKMAIYASGEQGTGIYGYVSADGINWTELPNILVLNAGDRTSLWHDTLRGKYVLFTRYRPIYPGRYIFRAESDDFQNWSEPELVLHWSEMDRVHGIQHYGAGGFCYGNCYVGFLEVFHVPYRRLDTQLICSRDGRAWQRVCEGEVFLPNGPEGEFDHFWAFPAGSPPIRVGDELWFYYSGRGHPHGSPQPPVWPGEDDPGRARHSYWAATGLAKMRLDGFAAMDASGEVATLITVPLQFQDAKELVINADADNYPTGSSWLKVGLLDRNMNPIGGFGADEFDVMTSDEVEHLASWGGNSDISSLAGEVFRLQFHLVNTRLYSFTVR